MKFKLVCLGLALMMSMACGGGGGGSSRAAPPADDGGANPPPAGGGGGGSGGGGSGATVVSGGLIGGSAGLVLDTGASSVTLDVAFGGTGLRGASFVTGDIQAFGSVIANGVTSNTDAAEFIIEGQNGSQTDLQQGQQILIVNDDSDSAVAVVYRANIKGPVTDFQLMDPALGRAALTVLGQRVTTDATTTFANLNLADFAGSATGSLLEISGISGDDGVIDATFVELETSLTEYKVTGVAANVGATSFVLDGLTIDYASAAITNFNSSAISNGDVLEVRGVPADFTSPDQFKAQTVERLPNLIVGNTTLVQLEGFIDDFDNAASFSVQTTPIVTDGATSFSNGEEDDLDLGTKVQVVGTADESGVVRASSVTVQPTNTLRAEGNIEDLAANRITVLSVDFEIRDLTRFEDDSDADLEPLLFNQLAIGDEVELRGYLDGMSYVATQIEREDPDEEAQLRGIVTAIDAANGSLSINGININSIAGITEFELDDDSDTTQAAFFDAIEPGSFVTANWAVFVDTDQTVDQLSIEDD